MDEVKGCNSCSVTMYGENILLSLFLYLIISRFVDINGRMTHVCFRTVLTVRFR